ncbi:hypothetical protein P3580_10580 [Vibrio parahaemolyticus]|nr:hypothetical protein [Vibrio parahaemolyticus]
MISSPLLPQHDETIHSFVFRICTIYGVGHLADVTNKNGEWTSSLRLNKGVEHLFFNLHDQHLIDLMRNIGWANKKCCVFDDPTSYTEMIKKLVNYSYDVHERGYNKRIAYCIHCIRDSIVEHGYGYFKSDWYLDYSNFCNIHQVALTYTPCKTKSQSLEVLKQIVKGAVPYGTYCSTYYNPESRPWDVKSPYYSNIPSRMLKGQNGKFIQISSCLKSRIKKWLLAEAYDFPIEVARAAHYSSPASMNPINTSHVFNDYVLIKVIIALYQTQFQPFMMFWKKFAIEHHVYCGVLNRKNISETMYIYEDSKNCQRCLDFKCPANLSIQHFHNDRTLAWQCFNSYFKLKKHLEKLHEVHYISRNDIRKLTLKDKIEILSK